MADTGRKQIRRATVIYWLMLTYIVAALVWWFISLERQNHSLADFQVKQLNATVDSAVSQPLYMQEYQRIQKARKRITTMHISEGLFFLALIIITAVIVFRSVRRQFRVQRQQQNFMMAVTHELKTPVSVARLNLETMLKYTLDPEKQKKLLRNTLEETTRLNALTNNILVASQLEGGGYQFAKEELDLSALLKDAIQDFRQRFPDRHFEEDITPDTDVKGDPLLLQLLISNLLENALKYSPRNQPVKIMLHKLPLQVRLTVSDGGQGVPDEEKKKIFNKFYRIGNEATRKTQGTGLGLYLCSKIARDHNADISVTNNIPHGSIFAVDFHTK